jgi:hypothetical protein
MPMPADLPPEDSQAIATVMLRLHAHFRRRHGLPPWPTAWTLLGDMEELKGRSSLVDGQVIGSPRRLIGPVVAAARRMTWLVLKPIFYRQSEVNRDLILALEALARDREQNRRVHHKLSVRIAELETTVAALRKRAE